jgi:hypothetical protein
MNRMEHREKFAQRIYSAMLSREEASIFYRTICIPSITYCFSVGMFNERQVDSLQGSLTQATLNSIGYNKRTPAAVVYGPPYLGGIGLRHLSAEQGTMQVQIVIQHLRAYTQVGATILIQLKIGRNWSLVEAEASWKYHNHISRNLTTNSGNRQCVGFLHCLN